MKKLKKKLRGKGGFSLFEMLIAVIVMLLVSEILTLCVRMSTEYYTKSVTESEGQTICATLSTAVQKELNYATNVQYVKPMGAESADGFYEQYTYYSRALQHGSSCSLVSRDGRLYIHKAGQEYDLVGARTYTNGLKAEISSKWNPEECCFSVWIAVYKGDTAPEDTGSAGVLASQSFNVYPLNKGF
ncbi:MAG: hypothetical protein MJ067_00215 [Oscillospiraceae bacterium]|nr:hypothetical protein [Oscillospiraceae bacterium]